ncbi:MAG: 4-hydroxy-3-methylbut-2-enyl diphosphate reductase [Fimbriimonadales bacterium]|nr:4-hydroxy-3-methylbut-2-enyl diphosphate reductase [Fimbriimonadales bacterium]
MERILLAAPRGFCAGVSYAIEVVELALRAFGTPLYVRHAIVHNEWVVRSFERRGVVFVEEIEEVPEGMPVVFSAHGVSPAVRKKAEERKLRVVDATCPLVTKVHNEARRFAERGYHILYIGHRGHAEAEGILGEAPDSITLIESMDEAASVQPPQTHRLALLTQTTLSVDEVNQIAEVLRRRFPNLESPSREDICYATTNRQLAVKELAKQCDLVLVIGSQTSSNSNRLVEVAQSLGVESHLLLEPHEVRPEWVQRRCIGITSGASTPEHLVEAVVGALLSHSPNAVVESIQVLRENVRFQPARELVRLVMR